MVIAFFAYVIGAKGVEGSSMDIAKILTSGVRCADLPTAVRYQYTCMKPPNSIESTTLGAS